MQILSQLTKYIKTEVLATGRRAWSRRPPDQIEGVLLHPDISGTAGMPIGIF
jgi:hypothetical protein